MTKEEYERTKENVFDLMYGQINIDESIGIENEFSDESFCDLAYQKIYALT